jgi:hypothetical protein
LAGADQDGGARGSGPVGSAGAVHDDHGEGARAVAEAGQVAQVGGRDVGGDDEGHGPAGGGQGGQVAGAGLQPGQALHQGLEVAGAGAEAAVGAVGGDEAHHGAALARGDGDGGGGRDRLLEGVLVVVPGPGVEDDRGPALPRDVVLAHGELVEAGGRGPVDLAQVGANDPRA